MTSVALKNNAPAVDRMKCDPTAYGNDDHWAQVSAPSVGAGLRAAVSGTTLIGDSAYTPDQRALLDFPDTMGTVTGFSNN